MSLTHDDDDLDDDRPRRKGRRRRGRINESSVSPLLWVIIAVPLLGFFACCGGFLISGKKHGDSPAVKNEMALTIDRLVAAKGRQLDTEAQGNAIRSKEAKEEFDRELSSLNGVSINWIVTLKEVRLDGTCIVDWEFREIRRRGEVYQYELHLGGAESRTGPVSLTRSDQPIPLSPGDQNWVHGLSRGNKILVTGTVSSVKTSYIGFFKTDIPIPGEKAVTGEKWFIILKDGVVSKP